MWIDRIVVDSISLVRGAWRKAFVVVGPTIDPSIIELINILDLQSAVLLYGRRSEDRECDQRDGYHKHFQCFHRCNIRSESAPLFEVGAVIP